MVIKMRSLIVLVTAAIFVVSGHNCLQGFPENITEITNRSEHVIPEGTVVLAPFLTFTCDGYITHVSVGYEVTSVTSNQTVYLQLRRNTEGANYSLIHEVLLPRGKPEAKDNHTILRNYQLLKSIAVLQNDLVGFKTPADSSVRVLLVSDQQKTLHKGYSSNAFAASNVTGIPQISVTFKTCVGLPDEPPANFNRSQIMGFTRSAQILWTDIEFQCNGVITELKSWFQVQNGSGIVSMSLQFQIWQPINGTLYELVSEVAIPSAMNNELITTNNLSIPFYEASIVGVYVMIPANIGPANISVITNETEPKKDGYYYYTNDRPCLVDSRDGDTISSILNPKVALFYDIVTREMNTVVPQCNQTDNRVSDSDERIHLAIIISTPIGVALVLTTIVICYLFHRRHRQRLQKTFYTSSRLSCAYHKYSDRRTSNVDYYCLESCSLDTKVDLIDYDKIGNDKAFTSEIPYNCPTSDLQQLYSHLSHMELPQDKLELGSEIGSGEFGMVFHGVWNHDDQAVQVAIKTLHGEVSDNNKTKLLKEAAMVEQFLHENIVRLYGVVLQGKMMMILEYLSQGNLLNHLQSIRPREGEPVGQHIPQMLLGFARDVGRGMNYLSNKCFIHRDLAARNILLTENNVCKIADFGLARDLDEENYYISQGGRIPVRWMPPEAVLYRTYTTASDVWSYGILLYEMWSLGHKPYEDHDNTEVLSLISNGYRLPPPPGCPRALYHTMIQCWHPDYHQRPNFSALLCAISQPSYVLFHWFEEDKQAAGPECDVIGAPIEAGCNLYIDLQNFFK